MTIIDWENITNYIDTVGTTQQTFTFKKTQGFVKVTNRGQANLTYTIGSQNGTLTPGQKVSVSEQISSFNMTAASGIQAFEVWATEYGTEKEDKGDDLSSITAELATKANQSDLNATNANVKANTTQISALSNGAPQAVSLVANMTDHTKNYVYTGSEAGYTSGHWYYWNGSAWSDGGVYQSTGLPSNTGDQLVNNNMFNAATVTVNYYVGSGGTLVSAQNFYCSDYIAIDPTKPLAFYGAYSIVYQLACYDSSKNYLGFVATSSCSGSLGAYTIPSIASTSSSLTNTAYVRANTTQPNQYMLVYASSYPTTYAPFGYYVMSNNLINGMKNDLAIVIDNVNYNTSLGTNNLSGSTPSKYNVALGYQALPNNYNDGTQDAGMYNVAIGYQAMNSATTANHNSIIGFQAGKHLTTGTGNTSLGEDTLVNESTGVGNVAIGQRAMQQSTGASNNTAVGTSSMYWNSNSNVTGSQNTAIGNYSGENVGSDSQCTFLGYFASKDVDANSYSNSTAVGANAKITKNNMVQLGNSAITEVDTYGDFQCLSNGKGILLHDAATGTRYRLSINNGAIVINPA